MIPVIVLFSAVWPGEVLIPLLVIARQIPDLRTIASKMEDSRVPSILVHLVTVRDQFLNQSRDRIHPTY